MNIKVLVVAFLALFGLTSYGSYQLYSGRVGGSEPLLGGPTVLTAPQGGTGLSTFTRGDLIVATSSNRFARVAVGSSNQTMVVSSTTGLPNWSSDLNWSSATGTRLNVGALTQNAGSGLTLRSLVPPNSSSIAGFSVDAYSSSTISGTKLMSFKKDGVEKAYIASDGEIYTASKIQSISGSLTFNSVGGNVVAMNYDPTSAAGTGGFMVFNGGTGVYMMMTPAYKGYIGFQTVFDTVGAYSSLPTLPPGTDFEFRGAVSTTKAFIGRGATSTYSGDELIVVGTDTTSTVRLGRGGKIGCFSIGDSDGVGETYCTANDGGLTCSTTPCN